MATKRINKKRGPFMFPRINSNFASGRYRPPSRNPNTGSLFARADPYARAAALARNPTELARRMSLATQQRTTGPYTPYIGPSPVAPPVGGGLFPTATQPPLPAGTPPSVATAIQNFSSGQPGQTSAQDIFAAIRGAVPGGALPNATAEQNTGPLADAARLFSGSVEGNPFLTPEAKARLRAGFLPDLNQIHPAFWRYTSPVLQQTLQGLYRSGGVRPEDQEFTAAQFTPAGLAR